VIAATANGTLQAVLLVLVEVYIVALIARAVLSWFPAYPGTTLYKVVRTLDRFTEPLLRPLRRILPPVRAGGMAIDLSIIVAILALQIVAIPVIRAL
jgi:YggT family protein